MDLATLSLGAPCESKTPVPRESGAPRKSGDDSTSCQLVHVVLITAPLDNHIQSSCEHAPLQEFDVGSGEAHVRQLFLQVYTRLGHHQTRGASVNQGGVNSGREPASANSGTRQETGVQ